MGWWILVFHPESEASMNYFFSDMSNSINTVVSFDWKTVIYIYVCGQCRTQFMLPKNDNSSTCTFTTGKSVTYTFTTGQSVVLMGHP